MSDLKGGGHPGRVTYTRTGKRLVVARAPAFPGLSGAAKSETGAYLNLLRAIRDTIDAEIKARERAPRREPLIIVAEKALVQ
jgi:hypothetical protein